MNSLPVASDSPSQVAARWVAALVTNGMFGTLAFLILTGRIETTSVWWDRILVGIAAAALLLLVPAVRETARWLRFRGVVLVPDPAEGSLGGQVGGSVRIPGRELRDAPVSVHLVCLARRPQAGRSTGAQESVHWMRGVRPRIDPGADGIRLTFAIPLPEDLPPTGPRHRWAVRVSSELRGADLDLTFPVEVGRHDPPLTSTHPTTPTTPETRAQEQAGRHIRIHNSAGETVLDYRAGRSLGMGIALTLFGLVFLASGLFAGRSAWQGFDGLFEAVFSGVGALFLGVFGLIGVLLVLLGFWLMGNGLRVEVSPRRIRVRRSFFLLPGRTREWETGELETIEARITGQQLDGARSRVHYSIRAKTRGGQTIPLGDGIQGPIRLERVAQVLEEVAGIPVDRRAGGGITTSEVEGASG